MARLDDGFSTVISFASDTTVLFYEKEVTPPGVAGGGAIQTSTMLNTAWRTKKPKSLKDLTPGNLVVAYDVGVYPEIIALCQVNNLITVTFPDTATVAFWGWLEAFNPSALVEGEQPTAEITVETSNENDSGVETAAAYTAAV